MPIILLEKDPFVDAAVVRDSLRHSDLFVRRPFYGLSVKKDTFAYIAVRQLAAHGLRPISLVDSSAPEGWSNANHNFIIQDVQFQRQEKAQIVETFGDHFVFFYGERPTIVSVSGALLNTSDFNWKNEWLRNYDQYLRGTKCVENRARVFIGFDDVIISGYVLSTAITYSKEIPLFCPFSFTMLLMDYQDLSDNDDYVQDARDTFHLQGGGPASLPEYINDPAGRVVNRWEVDPVTGLSRVISGAAVEAPSSQDSGLSSADWISGSDPHAQQWHSKDKALSELDAQLASEQSGTDLIRTREAFRADSGSFPLSGTTTRAAAIGPSLETGVRNYADVVPDAPVLGN